MSLAWGPKPISPGAAPDSWPELERGKHAALQLCLCLPASYYRDA